MSKQYLEGKSIPRVEAESKIRAIFNIEEIFIVGQGFTPCFTLPYQKGLFGQEATVVEWQIDALREINWKVVQTKATDKGLTVWIKEIQKWE